MATIGEPRAVVNTGGRAKDQIYLISYTGRLDY